MSVNATQRTYCDVESINILYISDKRKNINKQFRTLNIKNSFQSNNEDEVINIIQDKYINIIIFDKVDWIDIARTIRQTNKNIPIIIISYFNEKSELFSALDLKIDQYLQKPYKEKELFQKIENLTKLNNNKIYDIDIKKFESQYSQNLMVCKINNSGRITFVNSKLCKVFGYKRSDLIGKKEKIFWHDSDINNQKNDEMFESLMRKRSYKGIAIYQTKNLNSLMIDITGFTITGSRKKPDNYVLIYNDITEFASYRKVLESRLLSNKKILNEKNHFYNEYQKALNIGSAVCRMTMDGKITFANNSFYRILKTDVDDLVGENYFNICKFYEGVNGVESLREHVSLENSYSASISYTNSKNESVYHSCVYVPILDIKGELIETVCFHHDQSDIHDLNKEIIQTQKELIYMLAEVTEKRSNETGNHIKRVAQYCEVLAKSLGLNTEAEYIKIASTMHDIGKIAIDDSILKKRDGLTDKEYFQMKKHALIGYDILKNSKRPILKTAAIMAKEHHEKWDGSGYPAGLKGEEIHIYGRIVAIADVFDALASNRVYKKAWDTKKIVIYFKKNSAKQFDPNLVKIMFKNFDKFLEIKDKYKD